MSNKFVSQTLSLERYKEKVFKNRNCNAFQSSSRLSILTSFCIRTGSSLNVFRGYYKFLFFPHFGGSSHCLSLDKFRDTAR